MSDVHACHECSILKESKIVEYPAENVSFVRRLISAGILRFAGWWSVFAGLLAINSVCPICGTAGCPVGIGTTGIIAAFFAAVKQWGGCLFNGVRDRIRNICGRKE